jgi:hypothetical protein
MITNNGFKILLNRAYKNSPDYLEVSRFKVGIDQSTPLVTDNDLTKVIPIYNTEEADDCETVGNWSETTDGSDSLNSTTYKIGSGALNLIKTGTTADNVTYYNNNNMTSLDFTSKDLWLWIYFKDQDTLDKLATTDAVEIRYGNDYDTNYYYKKYDNSDLAIGWNYFTMNTTDGTEEGTVTLASCDSGAIKLTFTATSDTIAEGDIITDDWKLASSGDYYSDSETGFPTIDENTNTATIKCYLNSVQAVGYNVSGIGTFNEDSTEKMQDVFKFTPQSKSITDEIAFYIKNRIVRR